jgi:hypothetical protein
MNFKLALLGAATLLAAGTAFSQPLPNNFWPNSTFDNGTNLSAPNGAGTPTGWVRNGSLAGSLNTIDEVTNVDLPNSTNAIMVNNATGLPYYGEWDCAVPIAGLVNPGDTIDVQYELMWSVQDYQMRVALGFLDASSNYISADQYVVGPGDSPGWNGGVDSTFSETNQTAIVPIGTVFINVGVVSGGPAGTVGVLVVDDLYVARVPTPDLLAGNVWPNPSFEVGTNLNQTNGVPAGWNEYNSSSNSFITEVTTNNYVSSDHALAVVDNDTNNYGSWYSDMVSLSGCTNSSGSMNVQWFQLYSITNGDMRVTFSFYDATGNHDLKDVSYQVTGNSPGWQGAVAGSGFTAVNQIITAPAGATQFLVQLVSGGSASTVGIMMIDDLSIAPPQAPALLPGNFWPNPTFASGTDVGQTNGTPTGWVRTGSDTTIDQVITVNNTPTYALAVIDNETNQYGIWNADLTLNPTNAVPGNLVNIQYSALWSVTNGPMRLSVFFFDASSNQLTEADYNVSSNSVGWDGAIGTSSFTVESNQVIVPAGATRMRFSLASGGPELTTGLLLIENLSAAVQVVPPIPSTVLVGNFFPNPTFEEGADLNNPILASPAGGWNRGGSSPTIDQVTTNNWTSYDHSLELLDNDTNNYGQWYMSFDLPGSVTNGDVLDLQWFWLYNVTNGAMRMTFTFLDVNGDNVGETDFNTSTTNSDGGGSSTNWLGSVFPPSTFDTQFQRVQVPPSATQLQVLPTSGGSSAVTGVMLVDDLSVRLSVPNITAVSGAPGNINLTWNSMPTRTYSVLYNSTLSTNFSTWTSLATGISGSGLPPFIASYQDTVNHGASNGFYTIMAQ